MIDPLSAFFERNKGSIKLHLKLINKEDGSKSFVATEHFMKVIISL